jgi:hypothetical protein
MMKPPYDDVPCLLRSKVERIVSIRMIVFTHMSPFQRPRFMNPTYADILKDQLDAMDPDDDDDQSVLQLISRSHMEKQTPDLTPLANLEDDQRFNLVISSI